MKLTEKILAALIVIAVLLKMFLIPGGGVLLVLSQQTLIIMYFALGFAFFNGIRLRHIFKKESYAGKSTMRIIGAIAFGICISNLLTGILFKLQYWPGANMMLLIALIPTVVVLIIAIMKSSKNKDGYYQRILLRIAIAGTFSLILFLLPTMAIVKIQYRNNPGYVKAFEDYNQNPSDETSRELDLEYKRATMSPEEFKRYEEFYKNNPLQN